MFNSCESAGTTSTRYSVLSSNNWLKQGHCTLLFGYGFAGKFFVHFFHFFFAQPYALSRYLFMIYNRIFAFVRAIWFINIENKYYCCTFGNVLFQSKIYVVACLEFLESGDVSACYQETDVHQLVVRVHVHLRSKTVANTIRLKQFN